MRMSSGENEISLISYREEIEEIKEHPSGVETRQEKEEVLMRSRYLLKLL